MIRIRRLKNRLLASSLFQDSFWALFGNIFGKGLALLASIIIARLLGNESYGMYSLIRTTLLNIAVFTTFGLGYTATKYISEYLTNSAEKIYYLIKSIMHITLIMALLCSIITFVFSRQIAALLNVEELYLSIRFLAVIIIFNSITTTQTGILAGFKKFKKIAQINLYNGIVTFILSVVFTIFWGLSGALIALLISQMIITVQFFFQVEKTKKELGIIKPNKKYTYKRELMVFSLPIAMQEFVYSVYSWLVPLLLVKFSNFGEVGLYNAAAQWSSVIGFLPGTLRNVILSHVSSNVGEVKQQELILKRMILVNFTSTFVPSLIIMSFSWLVVKGYGSTFEGLQAVLGFAVFSTVFSTMSNVIKQYLLAIEKAWITFWTRIVGMILTFMTYFFIINYLDNEKAALSMAQSIFIVQFLSFIFMYLLYKYYTNKNIDNN